MRDSMTRRRAIIGTGALAAATTVGIATTTNQASATVTGEFTIPDGETVLADTQLQDVRLVCNAEYGYESNAPIHGLELELHVGATPDTVDMIARTERTDLGTDSLTGTEELSGSLVNASDFALSDFQPSNGELRRTVVAELRLYVIRNEEVVAEAAQTDTFEVTVKNEELKIDMTLGGTGEVEFTTG